METVQPTASLSIDGQFLQNSQLSMELNGYLSTCSLILDTTYVL
jgi:hypothetical protein